jgi:RNA polymerase-binding transcription factor DksA
VAVKTKKKTKKAAKKKVSKKKKAKARKAVKARKTKKAKKAKKTAKKPPRAKKAVKKEKPKPAKAKKATSKKASKPKSPLSRKEISKFRKILLDKRRSILGDMNGMEDEALGHHQPGDGSDTSNPSSDIADIGSDNYETEFTLGLLESERQLLDEINDALDRINSGTYGICLGTGKPIRKPRLTALPWCKYTLDYKKMVEGRQVIPNS